jgi:hypothetical protein
VSQMKHFLPCALLIASASLMRGSIIESISFDLSDLHAGSTLSGTFTLPDTVTVGDTAPVLLSFSDPSDYTPMSLSATITIGMGTTDPYTVDFSDLTFTNLSGNTTPIDTKNIDLMPAGMAQCTSFPCTTSGRFEDRSPDVFAASYTVTAVESAVPEPSDGLLLLPILAVGFFFRRRRASRLA